MTKQPENEPSFRHEEAEGEEAMFGDLAASASHKRVNQAQRASLVVKETDWRTLREHLLQPDRLERAGFFLLGRCETEGSLKYLLHRFLPLEDTDYVEQGGAIVEPGPAAILANLRLYARSGASAYGDAHSHPFTRWASFSGVDDAYLGGKLETLKNYLNALDSSRPRRLLRIVFGQQEAGFTGDVYREDGTREAGITEIRVVGPSGIRVVPHSREYTQDSQRATKGLSDADNARLDRNVSWLGEDGQQKISRTHVAVCGVGGMGAEVVQQLRGLGVKHYTLVDMDHVELSNLNRLPWGSAWVGRPKVEAARDYILAAVPDAEVNTIDVGVQASEAENALCEADFIVAAVDDDEARYSLQVLAARHLKPLLDLGAGIILEPNSNKVKSMGGQAILYAPGGPCRVCQGLDPLRIESREMRAFRDSIGYVQGTNETPAAVVTVNALMAGIAGDIIMRYLSGFSAAPAYVSADLLTYTTAVLKFKKRADCPLCGEHGVEGLGADETAPLPSPHMPDGANPEDVFSLSNLQGRSETDATENGGVPPIIVREAIRQRLHSSRL